MIYTIVNPTWKEAARAEGSVRLYIIIIRGRCALLNKVCLTLKFGSVAILSTQGAPAIPNQR